jgi:hypothetical protein
VYDNFNEFYYVNKRDTERMFTVDLLKTYLSYTKVLEGAVILREATSIDFFINSGALQLECWQNQFETSKYFYQNCWTPIQGFAYTYEDWKSNITAKKVHKSGTCELIDTSQPANGIPPVVYLTEEDCKLNTQTHAWIPAKPDVFEFRDRSTPTPIYGKAGKVEVDVDGRCMRPNAVTSGSDSNATFTSTSVTPQFKGVTKKAPCDALNGIFIPDFEMLYYNDKGEFAEDYHNRGPITPESPNGEIKFRYNLKDIISGTYPESKPGTLQIDYFQNKNCKRDAMYKDQVTERGCIVHLSFQHKYTQPNQDCTKSEWLEIGGNITTYNYNSPKIHTVYFDPKKSKRWPVFDQI